MSDSDRSKEPANKKKRKKEDSKDKATSPMSPIAPQHKLAETPAKEEGARRLRGKFTRSDAKATLQRWKGRETTRQTPDQSHVLEMGNHYDTPGGEFGFSKGQANQPRVTETKEEHGDSSYGGYGEYAKLEKEITPEISGALAGVTTMPKNASEQANAAYAFGVGTMEAEQHLSRAPGVGKFMRASYYRHSITKKPDHNPAKEENNPSRKSTAEGRKFMDGEENSLSDNRLDIMRYASDSSDSDGETGTRRRNLIINPVDDPKFAGQWEEKQEGKEANSTEDPEDEKKDKDEAPDRKKRKTKKGAKK